LAGSGNGPSKPRDGEKRTVIELEVHEIGPSLSDNSKPSATESPSTPGASRVTNHDHNHGNQYGLP